MNQQPIKQIELIDRKRGYDGFFKIDILSFRHTLYQGGWSPVIERELFGRGQAVVVLLYDLQAQCVVLVEQCRAGALDHAMQAQAPEKAWLIEPVAGMIDAGETPEQACSRETQEEAGVEVSEFEYVCQFYPSPGGCDEILHLYAAQIDSHQVPNYAGLAEEGEYIRLIKLPFSEIKPGLQAGRFNVASTLIALQWLAFQTSHLSALHSKEN